MNVLDMGVSPATMPGYRETDTVMRRNFVICDRCTNLGFATQEEVDRLCRSEQVHFSPLTTVFEMDPYATLNLTGEIPSGKYFFAVFQRPNGSRFAFGGLTLG